MLIAYEKNYTNLKMFMYKIFINFSTLLRDFRIGIILRNFLEKEIYIIMKFKNKNLQKENA